MVWPKKAAWKNRDRGVTEGYKSGLEDKLQKELAALGIQFSYESFKIPYVPLQVVKKYTPDFLLLDNYIVVESKGRFVTADRQKHRAVKAQYPDIDLRFVFSNPNQRISKTSKTTYAAWCESNGFLYAAKMIPEAWLRAPLNLKSQAAVLRLLQESKVK